MVVILTARSLASLKDTADALFLWAVKIENILNFADVLFKVVCLVDGSRESINEVVLI